MRPSSFRCLSLSLLTPEEDIFCRKRLCTIVSLCFFALVSTFPYICSTFAFVSNHKCLYSSLRRVLPNTKRIALTDLWFINRHYLKFIDRVTNYAFCVVVRFPWTDGTVSESVWSRTRCLHENPLRRWTQLGLGSGYHVINTKIMFEFVFLWGSRICPQAL